jgi:hypothetical protein
LITEAQDLQKQEHKEERTVAGRFFIPQTDIVENKERLVITMDLPGVKKEDDGQTAPEADQGGPVPELRYKDIKSAAYINAIIHYAETLLGIRLKTVKKYRFRKAQQVWDYLARRGVEKDTIRKFNIGYSPPYSDDQHQGRALIGQLLPTL